MTDPAIHPIDEHGQGEHLHARQKHYEHQLKNGGKTMEDLARGVSTILAGQMSIGAKIDALATRTEVREMIESHATTCRLARVDDGGNLTIGKSGLVATGSGAVRAAIWVVVAAAVFFAIVAPNLGEIISAWRGHSAPAQTEARTAPKGTEP